jgi:hypothetical protein
MSLNNKIVNIISASPKFVTFSIGFAIAFAIGATIGMLDHGQMTLSFKHEPTKNE